MLKDTGFSPHLLELEVTEDILLEDDEMALDTFRRVQALGVDIAFDDFGTGYASLTYLKKFPLDRLKIDKSFVQELRADSDDAAIVGCTINLGKLLGLSVIAEGIEDRRHGRAVEGHGLRGRAGLLLRLRRCRRPSSNGHSCARMPPPGDRACRDRGLNQAKRYSQRFSERAAKSRRDFAGTL